MYLNSIRSSAGVQQRVELVVDLGLAGGADLVVAALDARSRMLIRLVTMSSRRSA